MAQNGKNLVIVESPAKARTIERYLGKDFKVAASMGHVRDLPRRGLGVDIEHDFRPTYRILHGKKKVIDQLKKAVRRALAVYMATDLDREGEAIAWHLCKALGLDPDEVRRVTFNEITRPAITEAFSRPGRIDMNKVSAQEARRILDRLVGYTLSPLLWKKVAKGLSAGRVQSVAVRLVVEKEQEIRRFRPQESWRLTATLAPAGRAETFKAQLTKFAGTRFPAKRKEEADRALAALRRAAYTVAAVRRKRVTDRPPPPFITSELQRAAGSRLGFSPRKTMNIAQRLYEGVELGAEGSVALITYMRTDSHRVAPTAQEAARTLIAERFGPDYLPEEPPRYPSKKGAQEAHEAIRPTDVRRTPESVATHLSRDEARLYELIWTRFVASQMAPAQWDVTTVDVRAEAEAKEAAGLFRAAGRVLVFDGYTKVAGLRLAKEEQRLPPLEEGQRLDLKRLETSQHFTQPPARYTEASLVRRLEELGIGRPSTYATIVGTIQDRGYVVRRRNQFLRCKRYPKCRYVAACDLEGRPVDPSLAEGRCPACGDELEPKTGKRCLYATELGEVVTEKLLAHFPKVMDYAFTSHMEEELDEVEAARLDWLRVVREFWEPFSEALEKARAEMESEKHRPVEEAGPCPECGRPLVKRWSKGGPFLGCSGYPECKYTRPLDGEPRPQPRPTEHMCEKCGGRMMLRSNRRGEPFLGCENYPKCRFTLPCDAEGNPIRPEPTGEVCEKCGSPMVVKHGRRGPFLSCSAFPKCRNARPLPKEMRQKPKEDEGGEKPAPAEASEAGGAGAGTGTENASATAPESAGAPPASGAEDAATEPTAEAPGAGGPSPAAPSRPARRRAIPTDRTCPECGKPLVIRFGRRGPFLGCSGYPKCRHSEDLPDDLRPLAETPDGAGADGPKEGG